MEIREHLLLAQYTTFEIGGPARWFVDAASEDDVIQAVEFARQKSLPLLILGGGSNLLIRDNGFSGLVVHMVSSGIVERPTEEGSRGFAVAAGENWDDFVSLTVAQGLGGIECLAGIPGTVGGTPIQNVGAYGQEVSNTIIGVRALDLSQMAFVDLPAAACGFAYRKSIFNTTARGRYVVTGVNFKLPSAAFGSVSYKDVKQYFKGKEQAPTTAAVALAVREIRHQKGMLLVRGEEDCRSAGSFFKNPLMVETRLAELAETLGVATAAIPHFPAGDGAVKLPAAWLLEQAGFQKGYRLGRAGISGRHTLALINTGDASADDILALRDQIVGHVRSRMGIDLETEPMIIGD